MKEILSLREMHDLMNVLYWHKWVNGGLDLQPKIRWNPNNAIFESMRGKSMENVKEIIRTRNPILIK